MLGRGEKETTERVTVIDHRSSSLAAADEPAARGWQRRATASELRKDLCLLW